MERPQSPCPSPDLGEAIRHAQYRMLAAHMPHMYLACIFSGLLLAYIFSSVAPPLVVYGPMTILLVLSSVRLAYWWSPKHPKTDSPANIDRIIYGTPFYAAFYYALISVWTFGMSAYGDESHEMLAAFYVAICTFCGISFNANLPRCVYAILIAGSGPLVVSLFATGHRLADVFAAMYIANIVIQVVAVRRTHNDFVSAVRLRLAAEVSQFDSEAARRDIARVANTDALTGLPNRRALLEALANQIDGAAPGKTFAFALIDLDGFKPINDVYGHTAGDDVIVTVANRLKEAIGPHGVVARLGGDEFGLILHEANEHDRVLQLTKDIVGTIDQPIQLDQGIARISACCGIAIFPKAATASTELLQRADEALYAAKHAGRGVTVPYNEDLESKQTRRLLIDTRLRDAISQSALTLAYQPIRQLRTGKITSYEALARWNDSLLGHVSPAEFILVAEQTGLISALADNLFERALVEAATWPHDVSLSFNLSPLQLHTPNFALRTLATLAAHRFPPGRLLLEVTETALLTDINAAALVIDQLRNAGIRIALDDFGVGYAGFAYLEKLTFDKLKIDRSFVSGMKDDKRKRQIVKAIVEMCHSLDIKCIAEGIEHESDADLLKSMGCDSGQGYLLGRPGPALTKPGNPLEARAAG
ncbi:MAG: EAL domain-containing protein [Hyphomicrobiaceae bacterium]|nr:EAL domain-containing protein [Hyphomicrobiaceae bacterium]